MTPPPTRVLVLSSCTGAKAESPAAPLGREDFARGRGYINGRHHSDLAPALVPAEALYTGQQHLRLMRGVNAAREAGTVHVDLRIVSAGYGLVEGGDRLAPYESTFQGMRRNERLAWADQLGIPDATRHALAERSDLAVVLLGDEYLDSCHLDQVCELGGPTLVFCASSVALRLPALGRLRVVRLRTEHTRLFHCGLVGLKGEIGRRLLTYIAEDPSRLGRLDTTTLLNTLLAFGPVSSADRNAAQALF